MDAEIPHVDRARTTTGLRRFGWLAVGWLAALASLPLASAPGRARGQDATPLGLVEWEASDATAAANRAALAHHEAGRFAEAEAAWRALVAEQPEHDLARYNHACALVRVGRVDEARRELAIVLHHDLPSFETRLETDPDLAPLRGDAALSSLRDELHRRYEATARASDVGLVVGAHERVCSAGFDRIDAAVQPGVWDRSTQRFVPLAPRVRRAATSRAPHAIVGASVDLAHGRVLLASALSANADVPRLEHAELDVFDLAAARRAHASLPGSIAQAGVATAPGAGAPITRVCFTDAEGARRARALLEDGSLVAGDACGGPSVTELRFDAEGATLVTGAPTGYGMRSRTLHTPTGEAIVLPGHALPERSFVVSGEHVVVLSMRHAVGESDMVPRHVIDRVHLPTRRVERLSAGPGVAAIRLGTDGSLYVEARGVLRRYASVDAVVAETLPSWLHLTLPPPASCR